MLGSLQQKSRKIRWKYLLILLQFEKFSVIRVVTYRNLKDI